jgi:hypothetical protein
MASSLRFNGIGNYTNSVFGYYADGFFDRRRTEAFHSTNNWSVATNPLQSFVAHAGRVFFNPVNNASLFFPGAASRGSGLAAIDNIGTLTTIQLGLHLTMVANPVTQVLWG